MQPAGADQGLYTYVGLRVLAGELPYLDAWDQKPPAIHYTYALMFGIWPDESVVAATDMLVTAAIAGVLLMVGRRLGEGHAAGVVASLIYLLLANPAFTRLGGVRIRAQCETFIGLAAAVALLVALRSPDRRRRLAGWYAAGVAVGLAATYKYPAVVYALPLLVATVAGARHRADTGRWRRPVKDALAVGLGVLTPLVGVAGWFWSQGALPDLYHATITYNLRYSGETYESVWHLLQYLLTFPVGHARVDALWLLGGAGSAVLLLAGARQPLLWLAPAWVAAACLAIAINGSRGLPQYFVQAWPALALSAGVAGVWLWRRTRPPVRVALAAAVLLAVPRVTSFPKLVDATAWDWRHLTGGIDRESYLARFGNPDSGDKYSALAMHRLARLIEGETRPGERVLVFGFSPWAYVASQRASASRFFWSRPVIIGFESERPGYGVDGLLGELTEHRPPLIALQDRDWDPDGPNSSEFFLSEPRLASWLHQRYRQAGRLHNFQIWSRTPSAP